MYPRLNMFLKGHYERSRVGVGVRFEKLLKETGHIFHWGFTSSALVLPWGKYRDCGKYIPIPDIRDRSKFLT